MAAKKKSIPVKLNFAGIKQIGSFWYSKKDNYRKHFNSANECAKHFNGEKADK